MHGDELRFLWDSDEEYLSPGAVLTELRGAVIELPKKLPRRHSKG
jgi:hypothetical protein